MGQQPKTRRQRNGVEIVDKAAAHTNGVVLTKNSHRFQRAPNALHGVLRLRAVISAMGGGGSRERGAKLEGEGRKGGCGWVGKASLPGGKFRAAPSGPKEGPPV